MRAREAARRRSLLALAQELLDGQLGLEVVAPHVLEPIDDWLLGRISREASRKLGEVVAGVRVEAVKAPRRTALVRLVAVLEGKK